MRKAFDVAIIGAGRVGQRVTDELVRRGKKVALISLPNQPEDYLYRLISVLTTGRVDLSQSIDTEEDKLKAAARQSLEVFKNVPSCFFQNAHELNIGGEPIAAEKFIVASGALPRIPSLEGLHETRYLTALNSLTDSSLTGSVMVVGAGPIGVATALLLRKRGLCVQLISRGDRVLSTEDADLSAAVTNLLEKNGARIKLKAEVVQIAENGSSIAATINSQGSTEILTASHIVLATGFKAHSEPFDLKKADVFLKDDSSVAVNDDMRTASPWVWAAGAVTGSPFLLSLERHQAELVCKNMESPFFSQTKYEPLPLPFTLPLDPPLARLGMTEEEARRKFKDVHSTTVGMDRNQKAVLKDEAEGFIKIVGRKRSGELLGVHMLAPHAEEMIAPFSLILRAGIPLYELQEPHHWPLLTYGESVFQAIRQWI